MKPTSLKRKEEISDDELMTELGSDKSPFTPLRSKRHLGDKGEKDN